MDIQKITIYILRRNLMKEMRMQRKRNSTSCCRIKQVVFCLFFGAILVYFHSQIKSNSFIHFEKKKKKFNNDV